MSVASTYEAPKWLKEEFFQAVLRQGLQRTCFDIKSFTIRPATKPGDNYMSQMFRASVQLKTSEGIKNVSAEELEDLHFIVKSLPAGEYMAAYVKDHSFFVRETIMLGDTLPILRTILDTIKGPKLFPELYFKQDAPNTCLVLEDLFPSGFVNVNRLAGLDFDHSVLVVEHLAVLHAASLVAIQRKPALKDIHAESFWQRRNMANIKMEFAQSLSKAVKSLKKWNNLPDLTGKLEKLRETGAEKLALCSDANENDLNVLNHADPWVNNIMFKYGDKSNSPIELSFVDFQLSFYSSPAYDLLYFIFSSTQIDIRVCRLDDLLEKYHSKLLETCQKLNYALNLSFDDLRGLFYKRLFFGFFMTIHFLPFMMADPSAVPDLNEYLKKGAEGGNSVEDVDDDYLSQNHMIKGVFEVVLPFFNEQGVFDI